ncbi:translocase of chloroplast 159, chloroplastic-like [Rhododendron vialii]|uniref:translocase of chloroplast 159, chloroplastic-like n=1 Tax=Rhododendron vialii TaxID=182163 RepID=UPI00265DF268|nr:translocase of chloroplast 159, chloroplastic-like [Rhododendron vialii]
MASNHGGSPSPPAKVSLSTPPGSSFPIRAPLTVDSDFEYSASTNGYENQNTSSSSESSGFESEGFVSGEDEFETALERPFFADPDDETLKETHVVEQYGVSRPFVTNPYGEIKEESGSVKDYDFSRPFETNPYGGIREESGSVKGYGISRAFVSDPHGERREDNGHDEDCTVSRPLVIDSDEETLATSTMEEEDEFSDEPAVVDVGKVGAPIAMLTRDSDDDSVGTEEGDDFGFPGAVRVPGIHTIGRTDSAIKVEGLGVDEDEEDESQFEPALEAEVEVCIGVKESVADNGSVISESIEDEVPDDAEEAKVESFVAKKDGVLHENSEINEDDSGLVYGSEVETLAEVDMNCLNSENKVVDDSNHDLLEGINEQRIESGVQLHNFVDCGSVEPVDSVIAENGIHNTDSSRISKPHSVQDANCHGNGLSIQTSEGKVMENRLHRDPQILGSNLDPELELKAEVEDEAAHDSENSQHYLEDFPGLVIGASDKTKIIIGDVGQNLTPTSRGENLQDLLQKTERAITVDSDAEVDTNEENDGKELFDSTIWAALLKAAAGGGSGGGNFTVTTANGSRVISLEQPTDNSELPASSGVESEATLSEEEKKKIDKMQIIRVKFLRLVHRLGLSYEDSIASQVLYRLVLAAGRPTSQLFSLEMAKRKAMQLEAEGKNDLDFSLNILVLGKIGVGKSATINSILGEKKALVDSFKPGTTSVNNIVGTIDGIRFRIFDTPGLRSSLMEQTVNRKILLSIRKLTKKFPPDVVLYIDRLDTQTKDLDDLPLLRSITSLLGSSIWDKSIITLTHAASNPPDGPTGLPLTYDLFVAQRSRVIHQLISQAVGDLRLMSPSLMSPVSLVENHPSCLMVLPNGESWRPQLLLLCYSIKILTEANSVAKTQDLFDHRKLFGFRVPSLHLPYFLSSLLQSNAHPKLPNEQSGYNVDSDTELGDLSASDNEDEDEYDLRLPPFKPLKKEQIAKLSKEHQEAYFEEYDYRVRHLQKKQLREDVKRLRELKKNRGKDGQTSYDGYAKESGDEESGSPSAVAVPLPDMTLPPSFDGENHTYRYRFLEHTSQLLTREVMGSHVWDHDCGYDGVILESNLAIAGRLPSAIAVQITKDKKDFNIHLDSSVAMKHGESGSTMAGLNIQNFGNQLAYILKGQTKLKILKTNKTSAGVSVTFLGENIATGVKIEDRITIGKRLVLVGSVGIIRSQGDTACGGSFELRLREKDFPIGQDQTTASLSLMRWRGEVIWGGSLQSQLSIGRSSKVVFRGGLNSKLNGQVSVSISSSDQLQIALLGILPVANAIFQNFFPGFGEKYVTQ